jgi:hypothetical protein
MSSDNPKSMYCTELDLAEDEFFAEFEEKDKKLSEIDITKAPSLPKPLYGSISNKDQ